MEEIATDVKKVVAVKDVQRFLTYLLRYNENSALVFLDHPSVQRLFSRSVVPPPRSSTRGPWNPFAKPVGFIETGPVRLY